MAGDFDELFVIICSSFVHWWVIFGKFLAFVNVYSVSETAITQLPLFD